MSAEIRKLAVLGSGVMGAGIAAHIANAGFPVVLLDIVAKDDVSRNALTEKGVERQLGSGGFTHADNAKRITCGNFEDHLHLLEGVDWIIEAVIERLDIKQEVYRKVDAARKKGSVVSSNTSTIPVHDLVSGMSEAFRRDFMIAHFFNPPRHMRLLEVVAGKDTNPESYALIKRFADEKLGKQVVECKDTPGFIANRIGVYWMFEGLFEAQRHGITVPQADAVMGRPVGFPKTGVFGLFDLIGLDLMPLIAKSMLHSLPETDAFRRMYEDSPLLAKLIAEGNTGRKGKGGFYRVTRQGERKIKEVLDLHTGEYGPEQDGKLESVALAKAGLFALVSHHDVGGQYAWAVLSSTLVYAASLIPEIADDIASVDEAMKAGYSWEYGPFELIDRIGVAEFVKKLKHENRPVPAILAAAKGRPLYRVEGSVREAMTLAGEYAQVKRAPGHLWLADVKRGNKPVASNASASLWDLGDGIACLELTTKMNAVDTGTIAMIAEATQKVQQHFKGLVIGSDGAAFCAGANLTVFLDLAQKEDWGGIREIIAGGQQAMMGLKYAPFPVVAALGGLALGGGCEMVMHANQVQAHIESSPGLVELNVGLIPGWGGCKEMMLRHDDPMTGFELVVSAKVAGSAQDARAMHVLREADGITMNRARLLADAKATCLKLSRGYKAPAPASFNAGGARDHNAMLARLEAMGAAGKASPHDLVIGRVLAYVFSGGETQGAVREQQLLDLERDGFMELIRTTASQERIAHLLKTGKPLKN